MNHQDHVFLIKDGISETTKVWADLGSGGGAFTLALADVLDQDGVIYSVDKDKGALRRQASMMQQKFPTTQINYMPQDFTKSLDLPPLDGILMANSLHYSLNKKPVLKRLMRYLKPGGHFIVIEYDTDRGNVWVPFPMTFGKWQKLADSVGFASTELLATRPSSFLVGFYAALSIMPANMI